MSMFYLHVQLLILTKIFDFWREHCFNLTSHVVSHAIEFVQSLILILFLALM